MLARFRRDPLVGNVLGLLALFIALSGVAWAAATINSGDVVNDSLKSVDLKDDWLRSVDLKDGKGVKAVDAVPGQFVAPGSEDWTSLPLNTGSASCHWQNPGGNPASYFRDPAGVVHLRGFVQAVDGTSLACDAGLVAHRRIDNGPPSPFPAGYWSENDLIFPIISNNAPGRVTYDTSTDGIFIEPNFPTFANAKQWVSLDGISWRCGPPGVDGCP